MGEAMHSKSLIQFSVHGWGCVPSLLFDLRPNCKGNEDNGDLLQKVPCKHCRTQCPQPCSRPPPSYASARQIWVSLLRGHCSFVLGPCVHRVLSVPSQSLFPQSCVSSGSSIWVNGDLLQEGLCHTQVCCTQSPSPLSSPLPTHISSGDTQTQFCLSLCGVSGSWCTQGMFEPSEHPWRV